MEQISFLFANIVLLLGLTVDEILQGGCDEKCIKNVLGE
jgi:hypothetical protein